MKRTNSKKPRAETARGSNPFQIRASGGHAHGPESEVHVIGPGVICGTEKRGYPTPHNRDLAEIVVDASEGFIPLWAKDVTLRWRFQSRSLEVFADPEAAKAEIERLFGESLVAWGDAAPVKFSKRDDAWDFEIVMREADRCTIDGCVLASAFFPDAGRHELRLYPKMFEQSREEQVETMVHEIGHVFGLRHFFADISETAWPSEVFGTHDPFSIMNYGEESELTEADKTDLKELYRAAWSGELTSINGTPIRLVKPFHTTGEPPVNLVAVARVPVAS